MFRAPTSMALQGDVKKWDDLREIYRVNPLSRIDAKFQSEAETRARCCAARSAGSKLGSSATDLNRPSAD